MFFGQLLAKAVLQRHCLPRDEIWQLLEPTPGSQGQTPPACGCVFFYLKRKRTGPPCLPSNSPEQTSHSGWCWLASPGSSACDLPGHSSVMGTGSVVVQPSLIDHRQFWVDLSGDKIMQCYPPNDSGIPLSEILAQLLPENPSRLPVPVACGIGSFQGPQCWPICEVTVSPGGMGYEAAPSQRHLLGPIALSVDYSHQKFDVKWLPFLRRKEPSKVSFPGPRFSRPHPLPSIHLLIGTH